MYLGKRDFVDHIDVVDPVGEWGGGDVKGGEHRFGGLRPLQGGEKVFRVCRVPNPMPCPQPYAVSPTPVP